MYYGLIILSVCMFGGAFVLNRQYQRNSGNLLRASLTFSLISASAGLTAMLILNGFKVEFAPFTLFMAFLCSLNGMLFTFCGLKAMGIINLSLYSLFSMLGGMAIPFAVGIIFFNEKLTVAKSICFAVICVALALTVKLGGDKRKGTVYYVGIFVLNGMSGALAKIFEATTVPKTNAASYSMTAAAISVVLATVGLILFGRRSPNTLKPISAVFGAGHGVVNQIANFILVLSLAHVDASVQYPMVTGGVIIVSTLVCLFSPQKPSKRELVAVVVSFVGLLALLLPF